MQSAVVEGEAPLRQVITHRVGRLAWNPSELNQLPPIGGLELGVRTLAWGGIPTRWLGWVDRLPGKRTRAAAPEGQKSESRREWDLFRNLKFAGDLR